MATIAKTESPQEKGDSPIDMEKNGVFNQTTEPDSDPASDSDAKSEEFQPGVQRMRAITSVFTNKTLVLMFVMLYLVAFADSMLVNIQWTLNPYITSSFDKHGLLTTVSIVSSIMSACCNLTIAKVIDIWGRVEGFLFMLLLVVLSLILKCTAQNMETYVTAHTLYWTGHLGMMYVVDIIIADMTSLQNRMIMLGVNGTPLICSTFAGPKVAELFYEQLNFRWAFGAFCIIQVGVALPVAAVMIWMNRRAVQDGRFRREKSGRKWYQSIWFYIIEFDAAGIILITAAFALFLLPFNIAIHAPNGWKTGYIIAMEVLGILLFPAFVVYEAKFAPRQFLPWKYLKNGTILGSCLLYGAMFLSCYCWNGYFGSYLQVVNRLSIANANYVLNAFGLTAAIFAPIFGVAISYTGRYKWVAYIGVPFMLLGTALLIPFRTPETGTGLLVMCQIFVGFGSGLFATCGHLAVMVPVTHQEVAVVSAIWGMFGSIGVAIGNAIAGALWNNLLPRELEKRLPEAMKNQTAEIFGDMVVQMSFPDGSPERDAIVGAYGDIQRKMVIAGSCFMPLCALAIFLWKDVNLKELEAKKGKQTGQGKVF